MTTLFPWTRFSFPFATAFDAAGVTLPGALLYFYASGTATPLDTYSDADHTIPNTNPVVADASGVFADIFLQNLEYKVVLKDSSDVEYWTADPVSPFVDTTTANIYDLAINWPGTLTAGEIFIFPVARDVQLPSGLTGSAYAIDPASLPTGTPMTFTLYKNTSSIGSIVISTVGTFTVTFASLVSFVGGTDIFKVIGPNPANFTGGNIAFTFKFTVV